MDALVDSGDFGGIILTYNSNQAAAEEFCATLQKSHPSLQVEAVGGDLTLQESRDKIFQCFDEQFATTDCDLCLMVHNAGQYVGITSENVQGLEATGHGKAFGDGSLIQEDGSVDWGYLTFYRNLYAEAYIDLCERSLVRMKQAHSRSEKDESDGGYRGSIIGISSPGCNHNYKLSPGYDMPGSGKCVMEFANRYYALRVAPYKINVNVIIPGVTRSDAWGMLAEKRGSDREALLEQMKKNIPMQEVIDAKELGSVISFLASPTGGGRFMTGLSLRVDAGLHLK